MLLGRRLEGVGQAPRREVPWLLHLFGNGFLALVVLAAFRLLPILSDFLGATLGRVGCHDGRRLLFLAVGSSGIILPIDLQLLVQLATGTSALLASFEPAACLGAVLANLIRDRIERSLAVRAAGSTLAIALGRLALPMPQPAIHLVHHGIFAVLSIQEVPREVRQQVLEAELAVALALLGAVALDEREINLMLVAAKYLPQALLERVLALLVSPLHRVQE